MEKCMYCGNEFDKIDLLDYYNDSRKICEECKDENDLKECNVCNSYGEIDDMTSDNDENGDANSYLCPIHAGKEIDYDEVVEKHEQSLRITK